MCIRDSFPYFINKVAPVSGVQSLMDYDVTLTGEICHGEIVSTLKIVVPVNSLCPCSKKISERGAHNQRSHVTVTARINDRLWIEEIVQLVEAEASCEPVSYTHLDVYKRQVFALSVAPLVQVTARMTPRPGRWPL